MCGAKTPGTLLVAISARQSSSCKGGHACCIACTKQHTAGKDGSRALKKVVATQRNAVCCGVRAVWWVCSPLWGGWFFSSKQAKKHSRAMHVLCALHPRTKYHKEWENQQQQQTQQQQNQQGYLPSHGVRVEGGGRIQVLWG